MEWFANNVIQLELKYCERCGGLWLRPKGSELIFCGDCAKGMAGILPAWPRGMQRCPADDGQNADCEARFWGEGGNA